jgi:integrase
MGSIFPLKGKDGKPSGRLRVQITLKDAAGERHTFTKTVSGKNARDTQLKAEEELVALRKELDERYPDGIVTAELEEDESAPGTVGALLDQWEAYRVNIKSATTADNYRAAMKQIRVSNIVDRPAAQLTEQEVNLFLRNLTTLHLNEPHPLAPKSKNLVRKVLSMAYRYGRSIDATLTANPALTAEVPEQDRSAETDEDIDQRWFDDDEVKRLFKAVRQVQDDESAIPDVTPRLPLGAAWAIQYYLGLRPGEVRALSWSDLDLKTTPPTLHVHRGQKRTGGKMIARGTMKTPESRRRLNVPTPLLPWLNDHKALQKAQRAQYAPDATWNRDNLLFTTREGEPVSSEAYRRVFQKVCKVADIHDATPYALRHTCATQMVHNGVPLHVIASLLGHKDLSMLTKVYGHLLPGTVQGYEHALATV